MSTPAEAISDTGPGPAAGAGDATAGRTGAAAWVAESAKAISDPAPLGLAGFALTTFMLSLINAKIIDPKTVPIVIALALAYGGIGQFVAGLWEFRKGNTFGSTAFCSYGAFWISYWAYATFFAAGVDKAGVAGGAVGWYLVSWGFFTTIMFLASFRTTMALVVLFALLAATFYVLGIAEMTDTSGLGTFGGWLGIATAAVAWYTALAGVLSATFGKPVLPNPPMRRM